MGEFVTKHAAAQTGKERGSDPIPRKRFHKKQENHTIIYNVVDEIRTIESKKVSAVNHEAPEYLESDYDNNDLHNVENISLDETKEKIE